METTSSELAPLNFTIPAADGFKIAASIFGASDRIIVIHSAVGVPKYYYAKFARFLAGKGYTVVTYDYRGIGDSRPASLRSFQPRYRDWGEQDARAVLRWCVESLKPTSIFSIAHSGGAQILGLVPELEKLTGLVTIAAPSGAWRHWPSPGRHKVRLLASVLPIVALTIGYVPLRLLKIGEDIPGGVAWEWSKWSRDPEFLFGPKFNLDLSGFLNFRGPLLAISIDDDEIAPREAVAALTKLYRGANSESMHVIPADYSAQSIGHFGFFKDHFKDSLWRKLHEWIEARTAAGAAPEQAGR